MDVLGDGLAVGQYFGGVGERRGEGEYPLYASVLPPHLAITCSKDSTRLHFAHSNRIKLR